MAEKKTAANKTKKTTTKPVAKKAAPKKTVAKKAAPKKTTTKAKGTKKPTVATKKATIKKTTTASKAKKTTKKVTPKKAAPKNSVAKKATTSAQKNTPKVLEAVTVSLLGFADWKKLVGKAFETLKGVWWRVGVISLVSVLIILALMLLAFGGLLAGFGGMSSLESEFVNLEMGNPSLLFLWVLGLVFLFFMVAIFFVSFVTNIAALLTIKKHLGKAKENNPLTVFFHESQSYIGRYAWMAVRVSWFTAWPVLLVVLLTGMLLVGLEIAGLAQELTSVVIIVIAVLTVLFLLVWRALQIVFTYAGLIEGGKSVSETFEKARALVNGHWWIVAWSLFLFFVPIMLIQNLLAIEPESIQLWFNLSLSATQIVSLVMGVTSTFLSLFVFSPLSLSFIYLLMLYLGQHKKIKL